MSGSNHVPATWVVRPLPDVVAVNPPRDKVDSPPTTPFTFVPMPAVIEEFGGIDVTTMRALSEVAKGYTQFRSGDVLFAKITPCMENGKVAVVPTLVNGIGYGSTEFHVLRPGESILAKWVAHFLSQKEVRRDARANMTGSAGQLRVPTRWLSEYVIPVAPFPEQRRIVAKIEELFSDLDAGVASLERVRANLKRYRASVLKAAVEGRLTEKWRKENPSVEPATKLLQRILTERRKRWEEQQLAKFAEAGKSPPKNWRDKYEEPAAPDTANLPELPKGWCWSSLSQLALVERGKFQHRPRNEPRFYNGLHPFVQIGDLPREGGPITSYKQTLNDQGLAISRSFEPGTILVAIVGATIANTGVLTFRACVPDSVVAIRGHLPELTTFLDYYLRRQKHSIRSLSYASGGQPNINLGLLEPYPVPLPPLAEQHTIVADCDRRFSILNRHEQELGSTLQRTARLRQSILKRAFEGKLVPQDPKDEPATMLVGRIVNEREGPCSTAGRRAMRGRT